MSLNEMLKTDTAYLRASAGWTWMWKVVEKFGGGEWKSRIHHQSEHKKLFSMAFIEQIYQLENPPASVSTMRK